MSKIEWQLREIPDSDLSPLHAHACTHTHATTHATPRTHIHIRKKANEDSSSEACHLMCSLLINNLTGQHFSRIDLEGALEG